MDNQKKLVLKLSIHDDKGKQKALKAVSGLSGIVSIAMDMKDKKMTVIGDIDPIEIVGKLRKLWHAEIVTVGPAKEPEKKPAEVKKVDPQSAEDKKIEEQKRIDDLVNAYKNYNPHMTQYYRVYSAEENPNGCVIC